MESVCRPFFTAQYAVIKPKYTNPVSQTPGGCRCTGTCAWCNAQPVLHTIPASACTKEGCKRPWILGSSILRGYSAQSVDPHSYATELSRRNSNMRTLPQRAFFIATWRRPRICQQHNSSLLVSTVRSKATRPPKPIPNPRPGRQIDTAPKSIYQKENLHPQPKPRIDTTPDPIYFPIILPLSRARKERVQSAEDAEQRHRKREELPWARVRHAQAQLPKDQDTPQRRRALDRIHSDLMHGNALLDYLASFRTWKLREGARYTGPVCWVDTHKLERFLAEQQRAAGVFFWAQVRSTSLWLFAPLGDGRFFRRLYKLSEMAVAIPLLLLVHCGPVNLRVWRWCGYQLSAFARRRM